MANIKLKDISGVERTYENVKEISVPRAEGSGREYYVERPIVNYTLVDPPTHDLDTTNTTIAVNWGEGTFLGDADMGNFGAVLYPAVEGKTAKTIITVTLISGASGVTVDANGGAKILYLYEALTSTVLQEILGFEGTASFTAQTGWGQLLYDANNNVTGYAQITDPSSVTLGIKQPVTYFSEANFYAILSEVTQEKKTVEVTQNGSQKVVPTFGKSGIREMMLNVAVPTTASLQEKTVAVTQNGTTEVAPDAGYDGLSKATINVNVAGGGSGVQPDWNQNDHSAADFIKNRIGGFRNPLTGEVPVKTYTFDGDLTGKETVIISQESGTEIGYVKMSDDIVWYSQALGSTVTMHTGSEDSTVTCSTPSDVQKSGGGILLSEGFCLFAQSIYYALIDASTSVTVSPGVWFMYVKNTSDGTMLGYCKSVVTRGGFQAGENDNNLEPLSNGMTGFVDYGQKTLYLYSSTDGSTKRFAITVNDSGVISATEAPVT